MDRQIVKAVENKQSTEDPSRQKTNVTMINRINASYSTRMADAPVSVGSSEDEDEDEPLVRTRASRKKNASGSSVTSSKRTGTSGRGPVSVVTAVEIPLRTTSASGRATRSSIKSEEMGRVTNTVIATGKKRGT
jgi:hypothetical protein